ncbi:hypothetical protein ACGFSB_16490 [Streptomyces sp. NPDC048441]|uniref:hypothetical protein n=1 Tax=Streptomyces sp. NPDC048441 TaxID=3365552 RepID=UPI00371AAE7A
MDVNERVDALLGEAVRSGTVDAEAQRRAVAAFRSSWDEGDEGGHRARTRRRDDWRPRGRRRTLGSLRAMVGMVLAGLLLGGVAVASIATTGTGAPDPAKESPRSVHPSPAAPAAPAAPAPPLPQSSTTSRSPSPTAAPSDRASAKDAKGAKGKGADKGKGKDKKKGAGNAKGNTRGRPTDSPPKASEPRGKN